MLVLTGTIFSLQMSVYTRLSGRQGTRQSSVNNWTHIAGKTTGIMMDHQTLVTDSQELVFGKMTVVTTMITGDPVFRSTDKCNTVSLSGREGTNRGHHCREVCDQSD